MHWHSHRSTSYAIVQWLLSHAKLMKKKVNANKKIMYRLVFEQLDDDKSGSVEFEELLNAMKE